MIRCRHGEKLALDDRWQWCPDCGAVRLFDRGTAVWAEWLSPQGREAAVQRSKHLSDHADRQRAKGSHG